MRTNVAILALLLAPHVACAAEAVRLGVDVLRDDGFGELAGKRVGLITNHTGVDSNGAPTADLLHRAENVTLVRLFGPEHGIRGALDQSMIEDGIDGPTGLPVVSLYGPRRRPEPEHLEGLDTLVFDIQDIGCRFYTYISTMKYAIEEARRAGLEFVVLDRPNPINGVSVEGPMLGDIEPTFVGCHDLPLRHGMTVGELARLFVSEANDEAAPDGFRLKVVACTGWRRAMTWDETGLVWTNQSPNMRRLEQAILYPGVGLIETTNVSVGRGTDTPFQLFGAPWIEPRVLAQALNAAPTPGVRFVPRTFTPTSSKFAGERCGGVDLVITDPRLNAVDVGMAICATLREFYCEEWDRKSLPRLLMNADVEEAIEIGSTAEELQRMTRSVLDAFVRRRAGVLIYE